MATDARQEKLLALDFQHKNICNIDTASTGHVNFLTPFLKTQDSVFPGALQNASQKPTWLHSPDDA